MKQKEGVVEQGGSAPDEKTGPPGLEEKFPMFVVRLRDVLEMTELRRVSKFSKVGLHRKALLGQIDSMVASYQFDCTS